MDPEAGTTPPPPEADDHPAPVPGPGEVGGLALPHRLGEHSVYRRRTVEPQVEQRDLLDHLLQLHGPAVELPDLERVEQAPVAPLLEGVAPLAEQVADPRDREGVQPVLGDADVEEHSDA